MNLYELKERKPGKRKSLTETTNKYKRSESKRMSGSNNLSYSHWKPNLSLINNAPATASTSNYQNLMKLASTGAGGHTVIHQHHSGQLRIIGSPGSSASLYSPGSNASSSAGPSIPTSMPIPRAHQHNVPIIQTPSSFVDQGHHLDIYSQIGMQRIGQMFKTNLMANNNNNTCNNKNSKSSRPNYENAIKMEQSMNNIKQLVESAIGIEAKQQIMHILEKISLLQPPERLLLYLRMPSSTSETDPLRQPQNPLGTRSEINFTINWVRSHLEMDPNVSIPKQDVYDEYVAYCAREDVKPLSTADFGKVMKQIFPSIRPRRLGTRGNSRYCYAAMRKSTRLECPQLPSLGGARNDSNSEQPMLNNETESEAGLGSSASWKIIKMWAENLLNVDFKGPNELADHISSNYMSGTHGTISNNSRALLQKKLLQRKVKGRKNKSISMSEEIMGDGKKRRKKKLKKSLSQTNSEPADNDSPESISNTNEQSVSDEILQIKQEQTTANTLTDGPLSKSTSQTMPINLTNEHGKIKNEIESLSYASSLSEPMDVHDFPSAICKIEIDDASDIEHTVYCKKVRRAQEEKGLSVSLTSPKMSQQSPEMKTSTLSPASLLMRPPLCEAPTDLSVNSNEMANVNNSDIRNDSPNSNMLQIPNKRTTANTMGRLKKLRFIKHASVAGMNETKVDDIATDIIIPRERVVSICNMDKDALDDYLNESCGDSQEQEAELLQYFQTTSGQYKNTQNTSTDTVASSHTATITTNSNTIPITNAYPLLENYQLHQNAPNESGVLVADNPQMTSPLTSSSNQVPRKQDQINELRQYLQQNLHHPPVIQSSTLKNAEERSVTSSSQLNFSNEFHVDWKDPETAMHSASSSLTALSLPYQQASQDHLTEDTSTNVTTINATDKKHLSIAATHAPIMRSVRASSAIIQSQAQQSPNSRSKTFNFVPISPGPQSPRVIPHHLPQQSNIHTISRNTFLSPRRSPAVRKLVNKDLSNCLKSLQDPSISTFDTTFKTEISASAPASPSITPHHFQFNTTIMNPYSNASSNTATTSSNQPQIPHQHQASCSISGMCPVLERSQSVPLHCQSPAFNAPVSSTAYNSVCNSVAQTPVPSEFADFTEDNFLEMLAESSNDHQIKVEANDVPSQLHGDCIRSQISRSVPSTPLPIHGFNHLNPLNIFGNVTSTGIASGTTLSSSLLMSSLSKHTVDNSKSVPTTPIAMIGNNNATPFRYSPDHHRDFLINGNTVDTAKGPNQFYPSQPNTSSSSQSQRNAPQHPSVSSTQSQVLLATSTQPIEDLPNYSDVNDPIIEDSHLMNNL
ncbi:uncharacterized protein LOC129568541 isoform X2 [Sitodiplosis mosellana]|uniref:uncharacterized protein LOC129568541 isoform X2 n=1 Tax=Sitodiplosis mosellana TaxID=263140 RepID=UPI002444EB30|nr:uncharacterized protein LOC129568541 isoform X2 [Sitodiplosis mosellana]